MAHNGDMCSGCGRGGRGTAAALGGARSNPKTASNSQISLNESYGHSWAETTPINHINIGAAAELRLKTAAAALTCAENLM